MDIRDRVGKSLEGLIAPGDIVVCGCSGGPDSVACLNILMETGKTAGFSVVVAHVNYRLRGSESDGDEEFVKRLADRLGLKCFVKRLEEGWESGNMQETAREIRYDFFRSVMIQSGASKIAIAHNCEDKAETFLMHLLGGAGLSGLSGMTCVRNEIIRPLINISRREIMQYLESTGTGYRTDSTNEKLIYRRNHIRHNLIPVMKEYNSDITSAINRTSDILQVENSFIESYAADVWKSVLIQTGDDFVSLGLERLKTLHGAIQRRILRMAVEKVKGDIKGIYYNHVEDITSLLAAGSGKSINLPSGIVAEREYDRLNIYRPCEFTALPGLLSPEQSSCCFGELQLKLEITDLDKQGRPAGTDKMTAYFDYDRISFPVTVRQWLPGDAFCPSGMRGKKKKLQDLFTDNKIGRRQRHRTPVFLCGNEIIWVGGIRQDERFIINKAAKRAAVIIMKGE